MTSRMRGGCAIAGVLAAVEAGAASLHPSQELLVQGTNHPAINSLFASVATDGHRMLALGVDPLGARQVYLLDRHFGGADAWNLRATLSPPSPLPLASADLALCGDLAVVGSGFFGQTAPYSGAVYLFRQNLPTADAWGLAKILTTPGSGTNHLFGMHVATDGRFLAVGVDDDSVLDAVYLYDRNAGGADNWGLIKTFAPAVSNQYRGAALDLCGDRLLIGAWHVTTGQVAEIFERNAGGPDNWGRVKTLAVAGTNNTQYSFAVELGRDLALVGAYLDAEAGTNAAGAVYVYGRNAGGPDNWGLLRKLLPDSGIDAEFGRSLDLRDDTALVGAVSDPMGSTNIARGALYTFRRNQGGADNWGRTAKLRRAGKATSSVSRA